MGFLKRKNKKGNLGIEAIVITAIFLTLAIAIPIYSKVTSSINEEIQSDDQYSNTSKRIMGDFSNSMPLLYDNIFAFLFFGYILAVWVAAYFIDSHPIFLVVLILMLPFIIYISMGVSNTYAEFVADMPTETAPFIKTIWLMQKLPYFILAMISVGAVILYTKWRTGG